MQEYKYKTCKLQFPLCNLDINEIARSLDKIVSLNCVVHSKQKLFSTLFGVESK